MKISSIVATDKRTGKIVFAEGIEESNVNVQVIIPRNLFTSTEISAFLSNELRFSADLWHDNPKSDNVNLGEASAYTFVSDLENLKIEIVEHEVDASKLFEARDHSDSYAISGLFIVEKSTGDVIFAEGTDGDGYAFHQISLGDKKHLANGDEKLTEMLNRDVTANTFCDEYDNVIITIKDIVIA